jgi:hypothetical protein
VNLRLRVLLAVGGAAALTLALGTPPTLATAIDSAYMASPGGTVSATSDKILLLDSRGPAGKVIICKSSNVSVTLPGDGIPHAGSGFGAITALSLGECGLSSSATDFNAATSAFPWGLNITSFNTVQDMVHGSITGIDITLSRANPFCSMTIDGTAAGAHDGFVKYSYSNKDGQLTIARTGGDLFLYNVTGCGSGFADNDPMTVVGVYTLSPPQDIT